MKIKNVSEITQCIAGIPAFTAGEEREVNKTTAELLLRNSNFEKVETTKIKEKKEDKKDK